MTETIVSIHQPNFLPWLKLLDKILASDIYVAYDSAQYTKSEYHSRQKVKTHTGPVWLSVPVQHVRNTRRAIKDVRIEKSVPYRRKHLKVLRMFYQSTPHFDEVFPILEEVYGRDHEYLADLSLDLIESLLTYLDSPVRVVRASSLPHAGDRTERLIQLVKSAGGTDHLTSTYGADHQDVDWSRFRDAGVPLRNQQFEHPRYDQIGPGFVPNLAAVDMLFSCGRRTRDILQRGRRLVSVEPVLADTAHG